jgi:undecaprenyl-diphosphatase
MEDKMEFLVNLDTQCFYIINAHLQNTLFDMIMPFITNKYNWYPLITMLWLYLVIRGGKKGRTVAFLVIPIIALSDTLSGALLKPLIGRVRPCHLLDNVRLLVGCGTSFSFPSAHASNMFASAALFAAHYGKAVTISWFLFAGLIGYSRVYVGVHYPTELFGGAIIGILCALFVVQVWRRVEERALNGIKRIASRIKRKIESLSIR